MPFSTGITEGRRLDQPPEAILDIIVASEMPPADVPVSEAFTTRSRQLKGDPSAGKSFCDELAGSRDKQADVDFAEE